MRIVHLSTNASGGGAAIATYRIHKKLLEKEIDSTLIVLNPSDENLEKVESIKLNWVDKIRVRIYNFLEKILSLRYPEKKDQNFSFNFFPKYPIHKVKAIKNADLLCVYWIGHGFINPRQLKRINKPLIWRLSDMWPFTGGCHYTGNCLEFQNSCKKCPQLSTDKARDITNLQWSKKNKAWKKLDLTIVSPSQWMYNKSKNSSLFREKHHVLIHTGVDENIFKPLDKEKCRESLDIPKGKKVILFGAINAVKRKGFLYLEMLMERLKGKNYFFLVFGPSPETPLGYRDNLKFAGVIKNEAILASYYNAADVFFAPSLEDNLPNTVLESLSCGTPVLAFKNSGGVVEVVDHKTTGYLADSDNAEDIIAGINWIMESNTEDSKKIREKILQKFTLEKQVENYIKLYKLILISKSIN